MPDAAKVTPGVTRAVVLAAQVPDGLRVDRFYYPAAGHTHWHLHSGEQVLYGETGSGWVTFAGQPRVPIGPGEVIYVPVGVRHWHGATPDSPLVHLAVTTGGDTTWLGELSRDEYPGE